MGRVGTAHPGMGRPGTGLPGTALLGMARRGTVSWKVRLGTAPLGTAPPGTAPGSDMTLPARVRATVGVVAATGALTLAIAGVLVGRTGVGPAGEFVGMTLLLALSWAFP